MDSRSRATDDLLNLIRKELTDIIDSKDTLPSPTIKKKPQTNVPVKIEKKPKKLEVTKTLASKQETTRAQPKIEENLKKIGTIDSKPKTKLTSAPLSKSIAIRPSQLIAKVLKNETVHLPHEMGTRKPLHLNEDRKPICCPMTNNVTNVIRPVRDQQYYDNIDDDVQKMQIELKKSYDLFQTIGEKFESINFGSLKSRIRDMHLNHMTTEAGKAAASDANTMFQKHYLENRLDKLTTEAGTNFRRHTGEFGDIPELSAFFQACTQLQHGLETIKKQRRESSELEKRLCWATEIAYDRLDEIRNSIDDLPKRRF